MTDEELAEELKKPCEDCTPCSQCQTLMGLASERIAEYKQLFDLQWSRTQEADALYVKEHPRPEYPHGYKPDLGKLIEWLMERYDVAVDMQSETLLAICCLAESYRKAVEVLGKYNIKVE